MRCITATLALLGAVLAAPAADRPSAPLHSRQMISIGKGGESSGLAPGTPAGCSQDLFEKTGLCIIGGEMRAQPVQPRAGGAEGAAVLRAAVERARAELQRLRATGGGGGGLRAEALAWFVDRSSAALGRRQAASPCLVDLEKYQRELAEFLLSFPPRERARIWAELIQGVCNIQTGPIKPDPTVPGAPMRPDPAQPGAPIKPSD